MAEGSQHRTVTIPEAALLRLRQAQARVQAAQAHMQEMAEVVAATLGLDPASEHMRCNLDEGVIVLEDAAHEHADGASEVPA